MAGPSRSNSAGGVTQQAGPTEGDGAAGPPGAATATCGSVACGVGDEARRATVAAERAADAFGDGDGDRDGRLMSPADSGASCANAGSLRSMYPVAHSGH